MCVVVGLLSYGHFGYVWFWFAGVADARGGDCVANAGVVYCGRTCYIHGRHILHQVSADGQQPRDEHVVRESVKASSYPMYHEGRRGWW